jgi:drug/metabolite transporter (DMT)-like permease
VPTLCWTKGNIFGPPDIQTRLRMFAVASIGGFMLLCVVEGIGRLPLGDYSGIAFSSPAFTMVLSVFLLKDHFGIYRSMIGIILTVGVVIISRPTALFPVDIAPIIHAINET